MAICLLISVLFALFGAVTTFVASASVILAAMAYVLFGMVALFAMLLQRAEFDDEWKRVASTVHAG